MNERGRGYILKMSRNKPPRELLTPGTDGRFGDFGGRFVPETLVPACEELERAFNDAWSDSLFRGELDELLAEYAGRPSILTECHNLGAKLGIRLILKREDLNHTG
ncbi:MAG: tryptophan synthase subunit beta, partial [Actinomycetota bacterium]